MYSVDVIRFSLCLVFTEDSVFREVNTGKGIDAVESPLRQTFLDNSSVNINIRFVTASIMPFRFSFRQIFY